MNKLLFLTLFFLLATSSSYAVSIRAVEYLSLNRSLFVAATDKKDISIFKISMRDCSAERVDTIGFIPRFFEVSKYYTDQLILADGSTLKLYNTVTGDEVSSSDSHDGNIKNIYQDSTGEYIVTADGRSIIFYRLLDEKIIPLFKKTFIVDVVSVAIDGDRRVVYSADKTGVITVWSFSGRLDKISDLKVPIISLILDSRFDSIMIHARSGIYQAKADLTEAKMFIRVFADKVYLDSRAARLLTVSGNDLSIYDYNNKQLLYQIELNGSTFSGIDESNMIVLYAGDSMKVYDLKEGTFVGKISLTKKGAIFDAVVKLINDSGDEGIRDILASNPESPLPWDRICGPFSSVVSGVYHVKETPKLIVSQPRAVIPEVVAVPVEVVEVIEVIPVAVAPVVPVVVEVDNVTEPVKVEEVVAVAVIPIAPIVPKIVVPKAPPRVKEIPNKAKLLADSNIPTWVIKRNDLPPLNTVKSNLEEATAIIDAKLIIKNDVVKSVMYKLANDPDIMAIQDTKVRNRLIWMISSGTAINLNYAMHVRNKWRSSNGMNYVLVNLDEKRVSDEYNKEYIKQLEELKRLGNVQYMKLSPNELM